MYDAATDSVGYSTSISRWRDVCRVTGTTRHELSVLAKGQVPLA
jgi:hypothetical protein